jgi:prepilin peptidase CpaA
MIQLPLIPTAVVMVATLIATVTDVWKFKVYNVLTLPLLASGLIYHGCCGGDLGVLGSLAGALTGFGILLVFYVMGGMGAGDVKLMAGVGAWLGLTPTFHVFLASSLAAGLYAIVLTLLAGTVAETWVNLQMLWVRLATFGPAVEDSGHVVTEVNRADRRRRVIPFAAMVALGTIAVGIWDVPMP